MVDKIKAAGKVTAVYVIENGEERYDCFTIKLIVERKDKELYGKLLKAYDKNEVIDLVV